MNDGASIIFNGSVLAVMGAPGWSAYGATKAGVRAMTRILASELGPRRIRVNQVTPGGNTNTYLVAICSHGRRTDSLGKSHLTSSSASSHG